MLPGYPLQSFSNEKGFPLLSLAHIFKLYLLLKPNHSVSIRIYMKEKIEQNVNVTSFSMKRFEKLF